MISKAVVSDRPFRWRGTLLTGAVALAARVALALWAGNRFPPAHDGVRYHALADRIARGLGYTWLWPDGTVTPVAHYPIGYPALLACAYRLLGTAPLSASLLNALFGAVVAIAVYRSVADVASRRAALGAGLGVSLHPGLVLYTPGIMTEGAFSAAVSIAAGLAIRRGAAVGEGSDHAVRPPWVTWVLLGLVCGIAALIRPQALAFAPLFAWISAVRVQERKRRWLGVALVSIVTIGVCLPWTARNCHAIGHCSFVSSNAGWNLLIGAQPGANGAWQAVKVPPQCEGVFGEASADSCFGAEALHLIAQEPFHWLALIPRKLAATFDYGGIGGYYLDLSNPALFPWRAVLVAGVLETLTERAALLVCIVALACRTAPRPLARKAFGFVGALFLLTPIGWPAVVVVCILLCLHGREFLEQHPLHAVVLVLFGGTIAAHSVFFGAPRFAVVTYPWVLGLAAVELANPSSIRWTRRSRVAAGR